MRERIGILINFRDVGAAQLFQEAAGSTLFETGISRFEYKEETVIAYPLKTVPVEDRMVEARHEGKEKQADDGAKSGEEHG